MDGTETNVSPPDDLGDWKSEYRALIDSCGWAVRSDRSTLRVHGERAAEMLNGILTQDVRSLAGAGRPALLLTPKGRVLADLRVFPTPDGLWVDTPRSGLENVLSTFRKYLPPIYARFEDVSDSVELIGIYGPEAAGAVSDAMGGPVPAGDLAVEPRTWDGHSITVIRDRRITGDGVELLVPAAAAEPLRAALDAAVRQRGGRAAGRHAFEVVRIESGVPAYGIDMSDSNLAQETGLQEALSFEKGCYLGQEVVARIHYRGHVNRHLRGLRFQGDPPPDPGTELFSDERAVGAVTSAVRSPDLGPIGLGYVRREIEPPGTVSWQPAEGEAVAVEVVELPFRNRFEVAEGQP